MTRFAASSWAIFLGVLFGFLHQGQALANVSLKNGNFFVGFTDIIYPEGYELKEERTWNLKTKYKGKYGWGWGSEHETHLKKIGDGTVVVHEYGGGADNRFTPPKFNETELDLAVQKIVEAATKAGLAGSAKQLAEYKKKLKTDVTFRNDEWENFRSQGKVAPRDVPVGTKLHSNKFNSQSLTRTSDGYTRDSDGGKKVEKFDDEGHLKKVSDNNGNFIDLTYGSDGHLKKVSQGNRMAQNLHKIEFEYNSQGLVSKVTGDDGRSAEYKYNDKSELIYSKDVDGNTYTYTYDTQGRHNMMSIGYSDKTSMTMTYWGQDKHESIKSVKDRDGTTTTYDYKWKGDDVTATVKIYGTDGKTLISGSEYAYDVARNKDGGEWTRRLRINQDGRTTETTYNECCGLPLRIKIGNQETLFEYDTEGHLLKKTTPREVTVLDYDQRVKKVKMVTKYPKGKQKQATWSKFDYDEKGNLKFATNSQGKGVHLYYDGAGRIKTMVNQKKETISFTYNEASKPVEISDPALGKVTVSYTNNGEIKKVESTAGRRVPAQVMSEFDELLQIIRPAGVKLNFTDEAEAGPGLVPEAGG